jgi:hypothetical protein
MKLKYTEQLTADPNVALHVVTHDISWRQPSFQGAPGEAFKSSPKLY